MGRAARGLASVLAVALAVGGASAVGPGAERLYRGDYVFSADWFTRNLPLWRRVLLPLAGRPGLRYLEVGVFEGMATLWMLENVLTHPDARLTAVDVFPDDLEQRFRANLERSGVAHKTTTLRGRSQTVLKGLPEASFDVIYVDGSHEADDVLADAVLSWPLLVHGGLLVFDDYRWSRGHLPDELRPTVAVDAFVTAHRDHLEVVHRGYQVVLRKTADPCAAERSCSPLGSHLYLWEKRALRRRADGATLALSDADASLIEALIRSRPFGRTRFALAPELRSSPRFRDLARRLRLDL